MDVRDCLTMYKRLGCEVFGHPRPTQIGRNPYKKKWWLPSKYDAKKLEHMVERMTDEIIGTSGDGQIDTYFPYESDQCKT